jgi:hypothetical protein
MFIYFSENPESLKMFLFFMKDLMSSNIENELEKI